MSDPRTDMLIAKIVAATSTTVASAVNCQGRTLVAIELPATFASTSLTFQGDVDGDGTYRAIYGSDGNALTWTVANSRVVIPLPVLAVIQGLVALKVVCGSAEADGTQIKLHFLRTNA